MSMHDGQQQGERPEVVEAAVMASAEVSEVIEQPAKIMRIGTMIRALLEEARSAELDQAGRDRSSCPHPRRTGDLPRQLRDQGPLQEGNARHVHRGVTQRR